VQNQELRQSVFEANMALAEKGLVAGTFGNASGIHRESGIVAIKPSGVSYADLAPEKIVLVDLDYRVVEGDLNPSSDTKTHVMLYRHFSEIGGVVHTHSKYATAWAQAQKPLLCFGTTHADYFYGAVPCTRVIRDEQIRRDYEEETAVQIIETMRVMDYRTMPAVLVACHGPFTWGGSPQDAVDNSFMLETIAELNFLSLTANPKVKGIKRSLLDKHFLRKHGRNAYYGQGKGRVL
jgi:L-ribulose-5-phosphate 4-epimerase